MSFDLKINSGDIVFSDNGDLETITATSKLIQDIQKIVLTEKGDNKFFDFYGSDVGALKIGSHVTSDLVEKNLEMSVHQAVSNLMYLQKIQLQTQIVDPSEHILSINSIKAFRDMQDPRLYNISISVLTKSNKKIEELISVKII